MVTTLAWPSRRRSDVVHQGMPLLHELWEDIGGEYGHETFCLAGPLGDEARALLSDEAKLVWTVEAGSHFEAMSRYYAHKGWGPYTTEEAWDLQPYPRAWEILSDPRAQQSLDVRQDP